MNKTNFIDLPRIQIKHQSRKQKKKHEAEANLGNEIKPKSRKNTGHELISQPLIFSLPSSTSSFSTLIFFVHCFFVDELLSGASTTLTSLVRLEEGVERDSEFDGM